MTTNCLHYETVSPMLKDVLIELMENELFAPFRLVGGTNLSLRYGHRKSVDIDLFTDVEYGSLDFLVFESWLKSRFSYYDCPNKTSIVGFGRSYYIGVSANNCIKLDLMYTDPFLEPIETIDGIRLADIKDIIAMKMNVVLRGGRKKDFWDLHMLLNKYTLAEMVAIHAARHEWEHDDTELLNQWTNFNIADKDFDPICLIGKNWDDIKLDIIDAAEEINA